MNTPSLKKSGSQYFIQYKGDSGFLFTTNGQKIISYVQSKVESQDISHFTSVLSRLSEDSVTKIGDFTVVKTSDSSKYVK